MQIIIDEEFKGLIQKLDDKEYKSLEESILENGFNKALPIIIWKGHNILVDGHNRYSICQKFGIEPEIFEQEFEDREAVKNYMIDLQVSRRNIDPKYRQLLIGMKHHKEKNSVGGNTRNSCGLKSEQLAKQFNVSPRTVENASKFYEVAERMGKSSGIPQTEIIYLFSQKDIISFDKLQDNEILDKINNVKEGIKEPAKKAEGIFPVYLKLDKSTNTKLKAMSKGKTPQELIKELINAEFERRQV